MKISRIASYGLVGSAMLLAACSSLLSTGPESKESARQKANTGAPKLSAAARQGNDIVLYALSLMETGYRFGGKNPSAGLDCSGMVSYVYEQAAAIKLKGSAADIAKLGKPVETDRLRPGDLVFFNTKGRPYSHVGIYIGNDKFIHAPSEKGKVRTEPLKYGWFAARFEEGRTYFD